MGDGCFEARASPAPPTNKHLHRDPLAGVHGSIGQLNYSTAKAGVVGFTKSLAREWGSFGIRVNCLTYGYINTRCVCVCVCVSSLGARR